MSRSFIHLRRALFGLSCAIVFGFGATQALAAPQQSRVDKLCPYTLIAYPYITSECIEYCNDLGYFDGECRSTGCTCRN